MNPMTIGLIGIASLFILMLLRMPVAFAMMCGLRSSRIS